MDNIHILVTNDDGINAEGIGCLSRVLADNNPGLRLSVVAPDRERSAIGHAITMHKPLRAEIVRINNNSNNLSGWAVNGTPSDCVKLAVEAILDEKPHLVISGINRGSNLGTDVLYSGTVSAAVEGYIMGIPSLAVSLTGDGKKEDYCYVADFISKLFPLLIDSTIGRPPLININIPVNTDAIKGTRVTSLGSRRYRNTFEKRVDPRGMHYYWMAGEVIDDDPEDIDSDTRAIRENYISVTPIHFKLTDRDAMGSLENIIKQVG
jgi:5'-nucleotidase